MAQKILSDEEKIYLDRICRYLGSYGMNIGYIEFEFDSYPDKQDLNLSKITHFDNNYTADVPDGLYPIFQKIIDNFFVNDLFYEPDQDVYWQKIEILINCDEKSIRLDHTYGYYGTDSPITTEWNKKNENNPIFDILSDEEIIEDFESDFLTLSFNGSGDSGYIEDFFNNGDEVPEPISNWCYDCLEDLHGGWEINEGSQGEFTFNIPKKIVTLDFTYNTDENSTNTLWEEKF